MIFSSSLFNFTLSNLQLSIIIFKFCVDKPSNPIRRSSIIFFIVISLSG